MSTTTGGRKPPATELRRRANGEGSIRPDAARGGYRVEVTIPGTTRKRTTRTKDCPAALAALHRLQREVENLAPRAPAPRGQDNWTVATWIRYWHENVAAHRPGRFDTGLSTSRLNTLDWMVDDIAATLGRHSLLNLRREHVQTWLRDRSEGIGTKRGRPWSRETCRIVRNTLADALDEAMELGYVARNVARTKEPKLDQWIAKFWRGELGRDQRAPGDPSGKARPVAKAHACPRDRPQSVGRDQRTPAFVPNAIAAARRDADAVIERRKILHPHAELDADTEIFADRGSECGLQIGAMNRPIGGAIAGGRGVAERHVQNFTAIPGIENAQTFRHDDVPLQSFADAEIDKDARGVGRELDAGAGFLEPLRLLQHRNVKAVAGERERGSQSGDAGACDNDVARGTQDRRSSEPLTRRRRSTHIPPGARHLPATPDRGGRGSSNRDRRIPCRRPCRSTHADGRTAGWRPYT